MEPPTGHEFTPGESISIFEYGDARYLAKRAEHEAYVDAIDLISILQAKARRLLAPHLDA